MAPNAVSYATIDRPLELPEERKVGVSLKLAAVVAACAVAMFFAGRFNSNPAEFSHNEVLDLASFCVEGQYIGGCQKCKECAAYEHANGGCSYFKDTFCSYCTPLDHCPRELTYCTTPTDSKCAACTCDDPIQKWNDKELDGWLARTGRRDDPKLVQKTYACYIPGEGGCPACKKCPRGYFQTKACDPATGADTECQKCSEPTEGEYVKKTCKYLKNTLIKKVRPCKLPEYAVQGAVRGSSRVAGNDFVCEECSTCRDGEFVSDYCNAGGSTSALVPGDSDGSDTQCSACSECKGPKSGEFVWPDEWKEHVDGVAGLCKKGERYEGDGCDDSSKVDGECVGRDTICVDCPTCFDFGSCPTGKGFYDHPCFADDTDPPQKYCEDSCPHKWQYRARDAPEPAEQRCMFNAVCKPCADNIRPDPESGVMTSGMLPHCDLVDHRCEDYGRFEPAFMGVHQLAVDTADACSAEGHDEAHCDYGESLNAEKQILSWCAETAPRCEDGKECNVDACEEGFIGTQCQYAKVLSGCGTDYFFERTAKRGKSWFDESPLDADVTFARQDTRSPFNWVVNCMLECESNPFCHAFEVDDGGTGPQRSGNFLINAQSVCRLFASDGLDFCPTADAVVGQYADQAELTEPNWAKDCYINTLRESGDWWQRLVEGCPGENPAPAPCFEPCMIDAESDACAEYTEQHDDMMTHHCDSLSTGLTWCPHMNECVDQSYTPCVDPAEMTDHPECKDGEQYCYCTGRCMDPNGDEPCEDPITGGGSYDISGTIAHTCWEVAPYASSVSETLIAAMMSAR